MSNPKNVVFVDVNGESRMIIMVGQRHLDEGEPCEASACPVAIAIKEATLESSVDVSPNHCYVGHRKYGTSLEIQDRINGFDNQSCPDPFSLWIDDDKIKPTIRLHADVTDIVLDVKREHLEAGRPGICDSKPITLAIRDALQTSHVLVWKRCANIGKHSGRQVWKLDKELQLRVSDFDAELSCSPFRIALRFPDRLIEVV